MIIKYESSFKKDLRHIKDENLLKRIKKLIEKIKSADTLSELTNLKKLKSYNSLYRIRLADYRMGIEVTENEIIFVRILHRKDIYRYFP
ncbi:MAG: plasmid stabilization protein [Desulfobacteraceae bacterium 4572_88]|nr:MAG: plasmid stabilization protein [Desulfobacteraceae bacterium 4572_88]RLC05464.1 MAG: type II toxin-antitoxin system RelE/ParE family toxin [Deltaproteobacteria bacterium]